MIRIDMDRRRLSSMTPRSSGRSARPASRALAPIGAAILGLHVLGFLLLALAVARHHGVGVAGAFGVGIGVTAYTLGLRHAFDADHICAIDNTTRKLLAEGKRPVSVGFFFSLGHSSVVFLLAFLFAVGIRTLDGQVQRSGSQMHQVTGWVGTLVSGAFLYAIAALNLVILVGVIRAFLGMRRGSFDQAALEHQLESRGLMSRFLGRFSRAVRRPSQMYLVGLLFGLGFDTATEVALLFLAAGAAGAGLPFYAILCLPVLFAAGMSLLDTIDGVFMSQAYRWALSDPTRRIYYNIATTGLSVAAALIVGTAELAGILARNLGARGPFWGWLAGIDINELGFIIVGMFVFTSVISILVWRVTTAATPSR
jgi:nickel/cobalt transporter (NiCoT) family protein